MFTAIRSPPGAKGYTMQFMTRDIFDTLIIVVILIGLVLAVRRLYVDFTRPMPAVSQPDDDTQPRRPQ